MTTVNKLKQVKQILTIILFFGFLAACSPQAAPTPALTPISIQLSWTHQSAFGGLYAADQNGYYAQEGLAVTLLQGGPTVDNIAAVQDGKAQFGIASADAVIAARAQGKTVRAIAAVFRRSPVVFLTLANSGITRPQDFAGKTIRSTASTIATLHAMTAFVGLSPSQYNEITTLPSDVAKFASGEVPIWAMLINGQAVAVQQAGYKVNIIYPDDYGVHFYGEVIITTDELIKTNPDLVLRFLRASLKGWTFAVENPDKISAMVAKVEPKADKTLENERMTISLPFINTGEDHIGWMKAETWNGMEKTLREQGILTTSLDVNQIYTMKFLEEIYK
jgi:NitT/TauT family transport system substrate-binding protein